MPRHEGDDTTRGTPVARAAPAPAPAPRWTRAMKGRFLDELAAGCDVRASAAAIGVDPAAVYRLRRRDQSFADAWQAALAQGYEMLEIQLVGHALAGGGPVLTNGDPARPAIDVDLALKLMGDQRRRGGGRTPAERPQVRFATREETNAAIIRKLKALEGRLGLPPLPPVAASGE